MADEAKDNGQPNDAVKPRIEPDQPTPNRDKRRMPPTLDLKADATVSEASRSEPKADTGGPSRATSSTPATSGTGNPLGASSKSSAPTPPQSSSADKSTPLGTAARSSADAAAQVAEPAVRGDLPSPSRQHGGIAAPLTVFLAIVLSALVAGAVAYGFQALSGYDKTIADLKGQIATLSDQLKRADQQVAAAVPSTVFDKRMSVFEAGIGTRLGAADAARTQAIAETDKRFQKVEAIRNEVTGALEKRVGSLEALTTTLGTQIDQASTKSEVVRIQAARAIEAVAKASASPPGAPIILPPTVDIVPVNAKIKQLEEAVASLRASAAKPKETNRVTEARAVVAPPKVEPANVAIVAQALVDAFDNQRPLGTILASARALGVGDKVGALQVFADNGAPSLRSLADEFDALRPKMQASMAKPPPKDFLGRLSASAASMVTVESTDESASASALPSDALVAALARISEALKKGDGAAAYAQWEQLAEKPHQIAQGWAERLKARNDAAAALNSFSSETLAALGKSRS